MISGTSTRVDRVREMLETAQDTFFDVTHAQDASCVRDPAIQPKIDVVLIDFPSRDGTGLDVLTEMVAASPTLPIIALDRPADTERGIAAIQAGAQDYLHTGGIDGATLSRRITSRKVNDSDSPSFTATIATPAKPPSH